VCVITQRHYHLPAVGCGAALPRYADAAAFAHYHYTVTTLPLPFYCHSSLLLDISRSSLRCLCSVVAVLLRGATLPSIHYYRFWRRHLTFGMVAFPGLAGRTAGGSRGRAAVALVRPSLVLRVVDSRHIPCVARWTTFHLYYPHFSSPGRFDLALHNMSALLAEGTTWLRFPGFRTRTVGSRFTRAFMTLRRGTPWRCRATDGLRDGAGGTVCDAHAAPFVAPPPALQTVLCAEDGAPSHHTPQRAGGHNAAATRRFLRAGEG